MFFNSIDFAIFLPVVFVLYWYVTAKNLQLQNLLIVVASYVFYGWWDWRFLTLIFFSTIVDFLVGKGLQKQTKVSKRKLLLWTSIAVNLGLLGFFKYYNFFLDNFVTAFSFFGKEIQGDSLDIILPVGISFYTFQTLSYSIDVYKRKLQPSNNFISFAAFVCFFPQLVAGPIERASNLLPQFSVKRNFIYSKAVDGLRQILWGLFKKVVIADNCAEYANTIFDNYADYPGSSLALGAVFFALQIYGDFSGYSDIAIGTSRLFGFDLKQNFAFPYFSRDIAEFWRRWHISLSSWFRDYVYIPLGGSIGSSWKKIRNVFIIFLLSGFWHGANWTFIVWGGLNALYFLPLILTNNNRNNISIVAEGRLMPSLVDTGKILLTFTLSTFAWIFFRAESMEQAISYIDRMFSSSIISTPYILETSSGLPIFPKVLILLIAIFLIIEWLGREGQYAIERLTLSWKRPFRYLFYYFIILSLFLFCGKEQGFIYFQF